VPAHAPCFSLDAPQWQQPVLMKLERPVDVDGNPWPLDAEGKPIVEASAQ
jgi:hypothetical protein